MTDKNQRIFLSPSKINLFEECSLCFWLQEVRGIHRPKPPFPTLPGGMDLLIKNYFDKYRRLGKLPPEIEGQVSGKLLPNQSLLNQWRNWKTGPRYIDKKFNAELRGALDECFVDGDFYIPVDYKTRGFGLKSDSLSYYQTQLDSYTLLLEAEGYRHPSFSYLIYYIPERVGEGGAVKFKVEPQKLKTNPKRALEVFRQAVKILRGPQPQSHSECKFCSWGNDFVNLE